MNLCSTLRYLVVFLILFKTGVAAQTDDFFLLNKLPAYNHALLLETSSETSANVTFGDVNGDGNLDIVLAKGRHWPLVNRVLLGDGKGGIASSYDLAETADRSYSGLLADMDGDGDLDIVVSNDKPDPKRVYLNDGNGHFDVVKTFGDESWPTRNASIVDINGDGLPDVVMANRGRGNASASYACINQGDGKLDGECLKLVQYPATTITPADFNKDGLVDLAIPHRNGGQSYVWLQTEGEVLQFTKLPFGESDAAIRVAQAADLNSDGLMDIVAIDTRRGVSVYLQQASGAFAPARLIDDTNAKPYALAVADLNSDGLADIIVGNVKAPSVIYYNDGRGGSFYPSIFGDDQGTVYGFDVADFDKDGRPDIAAARSGAPNIVYFSKPEAAGSVSQNWSSFRGEGGSGVAEGYTLPAFWNADSSAGKIEGVLWRSRLPGLGHSSPTIYGNRLFVASAIAEKGEAPLMIGRSGKSTAADDDGEQEWVIFCFDKFTGAELWRKTAHRGQPKASRHMKATHANTSVTTDGKHLVAFFGSEGLYCYNLDGELLWKRDLGVINISKYGIGWGFSSSPVIHEDRIALVCDDPDDPFVAVVRLADGEEIWRASRKEISERSWGSPFIHSGPERTQMVVNGWPWVVSYDLKTGEEIWRIHDGGDNPTPTPFEANGWIYITSSHGDKSPIYVVRPEATGDITPSAEKRSSDGMVWSVDKGGSYLSTPVVYNGLLYLGNTNGTVRCFDAVTGEKIYQERLDAGAGIISSLVAGDGKIYSASENGTVYVLAAGREFKVLSRSQMGEPNFASPAISQGVLYFRTTKSIVAVK